MKQPKIKIKESTKDWGLKSVVSLNWHMNRIYSIQVDWYGTGRDLLIMYDEDNTGKFLNSYKNLEGELIIN